MPSLSDRVSHSVVLASSVSSVLQTAPATTELTSQQLAHVGFDLLLNSVGNEHVVGLDILKRLINPYIAASELVNAAGAALGAASQLQQDLQSSPAQSRLRFEKHYGSAVRSVREELLIPGHDSRAVLASCVFLMAVELVLRRRQDALMHLRGAHRVVDANRTSSHQRADEVRTTPTDILQQVAMEVIHVFDSDNELLLFYTFDVQVLSFHKGIRSPAVQPVALGQLEETIRKVGALDALDRTTVHLLHASLACMTAAARDASHNYTEVPVGVERNRLIALLLRWTSFLTDRISETSSEQKRIHLLVLRNLCQSVLIEIQASFSTHEVAWDTFSDVFQEIIRSAEEICRHQMARKQGARNLSEVGFTTQPGVLQPVYLAATKYRARTWRRRALSCLRQCEREGPWLGAMVAAIAERIMDIEESAQPTRSQHGGTGTHLSDTNDEAAVPEHVRISLCALRENNGSIEGTAWPNANSGVTVITLLRRRRPVVPLAASVMISAHWGRSGTQTESLANKTLSEEDWEQWNECIRFESGNKYTILS